MSGCADNTQPGSGSSAGQSANDQKNRGDGDNLGGQSAGVEQNMPEESMTKTEEEPPQQQTKGTEDPHLTELRAQIVAFNEAYPMRTELENAKAFQEMPEVMICQQALNGDEMVHGQVFLWMDEYIEALSE